MLRIPKDWSVSSSVCFLEDSCPDLRRWLGSPNPEVNTCCFLFWLSRERSLTLMTPLRRRKPAEEHLCTLLQLFFSDSFSPPKLCLHSAPAQDHTHPGNFLCSYKISIVISFSIKWGWHWIPCRDFPIIKGSRWHTGESQWILHVAHAKQII